MKTSILILILAAGIIWFQSGEAPRPPRRGHFNGPVTREAAPVPTGTTPDVLAGGFDHARLFQQLATASDPAIFALTENMLSADTAQAKGQTADQLAAIGSHESVSHLLMLAALQDDSTHRSAILEGLNNVTHPDGLATLASTLTATRDAEVLTAATATLARAGDAETLGALVEFYRERNDGPQQKNALLHAIASLRNPTVQRPLAKLAQSAEPGLASAAREALLAQ